MQLYCEKIGADMADDADKLHGRRQTLEVRAVQVEHIRLTLG